MCEGNQTQVTEFIILGFHGLNNLKSLLLAFLVPVYAVIISGNLLIFFLVTNSDQLNIPMFYFLKHLALLDILLTTNIVPVMLDVIIKEQKAVTVTGCLTQLYFFCIFSGVQCSLLAVMSYDRYLAVYNPLNYTLSMSPEVCFRLVVGSWLLLVTCFSSEMVLICQLEFCGYNYINHFFCDFGPVVGLATSDTSILMLQDILFSIPFMFCPFVLIVVTYILIFFTIIRIPSVNGRRKFFSTCSSHLMTVCTYYVTLIVVYMASSGGDSTDVNKFRSLLYIVVTPFMNPIIYSLRNQEIRGELGKVVKYIIIGVRTGCAWCAQAHPNVGRKVHL